LELLKRTETDWNFAACFVVNMEDYWETGVLKPDNCLGENVTGDGLDQIFKPGTAIETLAAPTREPTVIGIVAENDLLFDPAFFILGIDNAGIRINNPATGRQVHG
jgi:hypothetical protein